MADSDQRSTGGFSWKIVLVAAVVMFVLALIQLSNSNWIIALIQGLLAALFFYQAMRVRRSDPRR
jgi:uncharacterized protein YqfA (UPF0365 family)